ncbi:MAG: hypothetical protein AAF826_04740 [Pseudomonadota bacterium]
MKIFAAASITIFLASSLSAADWPIRIAELGCKFEFVERQGNTNEATSFEISEVLEFPKIRAVTETTGSNTRSSMADLLGKADNGTVIDSVFCGDWCIGANNSSEKQLELIPLQVGNAIEVSSVATSKVQVIEQRFSPIFEGSIEYLVRTSIGGAGNENLAIARDIWWNVELGFFTELKDYRNVQDLQLVATSCPVAK